METLNELNSGWNPNAISAGALIEIHDAIARPVEHSMKIPSSIRREATGGERYTKSEKIRIVQLFAESSNACHVQRRFQQEFQRKPPSVKTIRALFKKFKDTGSIGRKPYSQRIKPRSNEETVTRVKEYFQAKPGVSTRQAAKVLDLSRSTVAKIIQELKGKEGGQIKRSRIMKKYGGTQRTRKLKACSTIRTRASRRSSVKNSRSNLADLMTCMSFAALKLKNQRQGDVDATPSINFGIEVANILVQEGGVEDLEIIQAAILQRTVEAGQSSLQELSSRFSSGVAALVNECICAATSDFEKIISRDQLTSSGTSKSHGAQVIGMANKIYELREYCKSSPTELNEQMRNDCLLRTKQHVQQYYSANYSLASQLQSIFTDQIK